MKNETLETALLLSSIGLPMFECRGKVPAAKEWQAATSPEPQTAATWQSYGLACGRNSGFWVLDIDTKNGQPGLQNLTALEAEYGPLPATMVVETPSGGRHYYFRFEEGLRIANRAGDIAAGVDVRGHDEAGEPLGYVCGPGSQLENGSYRVVSGFDLFPAGLPAAPDWLLFLANFNKRDREKLAELGIHGAKDFAGAPPKAWKALAGKFLSLTRPERKASGEAPAPVSGDAALNYVKAAIEGLLSDLVAEAADNHRNEPANITALHIHGDLKGAIEKGADIGAVADLEHWAHAEFLAVCQGIEFEADKPNPEKLAEDLWQRCKHDAKPRNLDHVGRKTADATSQFGALPHSIEGTSAPVSRFKFIDDEPPIKSIDWLVDDLIPAKSFGFIAGASGSGKSAVALDLAMSLAAGTPFFGRSIPKAGGVIVIAGEHAYGVAPRVEAAKRGRHGAGKGVPLVYAEPGDALAGGDALTAFVDEMKGAAAAMECRYGLPTRLIVVDTLAASFAIEDENSAGQAKAAIAVAKKLGEAIGAAVLIVHHHGKNAEVGMRGSSAYFGSADFVLTVNKKKTEAVGRLILDKSRDAQDGITVGQFTLVPQVIGTKPDGSQFTQIYVNQTEFEPLPQFEPTDAGSAAFIKAVDRALADHGRNEDVPGVGSSIRVVEQRHVRHAFTETYGTAKDGERRSKEAINQEFNRAKIKAAQAVARSGEGNETKFWRVTL